MAYPISTKKGKDYIRSFEEGEYDAKKLDFYDEEDHNKEEKDESNKVFADKCLKYQPKGTYIIVLDGPEMKTCKYLKSKNYKNIIAIQGSYKDYLKMENTKREFYNILKDVIIINDDLLSFVKGFDKVAWAIYYDAMSSCINGYNINLMYSFKKILHPKGFVATTLFCRVCENMNILKKIYGLKHMDEFYKSKKADLYSFISVTYWNIMQTVFNNNINMVYIRDYNTIRPNGSKGNKLFLCIYKVGEKQNWEDCEYAYGEPVDYGYDDDNKLMLKVSFVSFNEEWLKIDDILENVPDYMQQYKEELRALGYKN